MIPVYVVDSFTSRPFAGNPAGVCVLDNPAPEDWMQQVAAEMKHAETAFLHPEGDSYRLRWFTPTVEVDLCGHATLAAAHILWTTERLDVHAQACFKTKSGDLLCSRHGFGIQMDFPAERVVEEMNDPGLLEMLRLDGAVYLGRNRMDVLVVVQDANVVRSMDPDLEALKEFPTRGVIVTAASSGEEDFVSRFFAPAAGVPEDSVTGSAHCCLGPYWAEKLGKHRVVGYQCSPRGGEVGVVVQGDRVLLQGKAVTVLEGTLHLAIT